VPTGARALVDCSAHGCRKQTRRADARGRVTFPELRGKRLRAGVKLTIRVVKEGYVGSARRYLIERNDLQRLNYCIPAGSTTLKKSCSTVR
jgi:hypothetical protein